MLFKRAVRLFGIQIAVLIPDDFFIHFPYAGFGNLVNKHNFVG